MNGPLLIFAPHADDEILGCGGYLSLAAERKCRIKVVVVTDGSLGAVGKASEKQQLVLRRELESRSGLALLGVPEIEYWRYPDGAVPLSGGIAEKCRELVSGWQPKEIFLPAPEEAHPDHRRLTRMLINALADNWRGRLLFYETVRPALSVNRAIDISNVISRKLAAIAEHKSQTSLYDYEKGINALAGLRGLQAGVEYAEGFLEFFWEGEWQNFFPQRPLISVVMRGNDLCFLRCALNSLLAQSYDQIEIILVWHGQENKEAVFPEPPFDLLDIRIINGDDNRSRNLNLGVEAARGDYIAFLDQDDYLYPEHFATLLAALHGSPELDMVHAAILLRACQRQGDKIVPQKELGVLSHETPPGRLLVGNTLPIHASLYRTAVLRAFPFDETLSAYEDWEMLSRLEMTALRRGRLTEVTGEYRLYNLPDEDQTKNQAELLAAVHARKNYLGWNKTVYAMIAERLDGKALMNIASLLTEKEKQLTEAKSEITALKKHITILDQEKHELDQLHRMINDGLTALNIDSCGREGLARLLGRQLASTTMFAIILPVHDTDPQLLRETIFSVVNQSYPGWELCLVDDASTNTDTLAIVEKIIRHPDLTDRLHYKRRTENGGIAAASNDGISLAKAPYLLFLDHDDLLHNDALLHLAIALAGDPKPDLIYTDSRTVDRTGCPIHTYEKPDWAPETLLHMNYINHLTVVRRDLLTELKGVREEFDGSQDWDMLLRLLPDLSPEQVLHLRLPLYDWRATETSVSYRADSKPWAFAAGCRAVARHLTERGMPEAEAIPNPRGPGVLCYWRNQTPRVEVIIPTHNNHLGLQCCLNGLLTETDYPNMAITVIANRVTDPEMTRMLAEYQQTREINLQIDEQPFNWAALNNRAAAASDCPLLLFLNDDIEVTDRRWLLNLVRYLELEKVAAVGATLFFPNGAMQHNGINTDPHTVAHNITSWGDRRELAAVRNVSAVTGAAMLLRRDIFTAVSGFDERFASNYNDVDLCLELRQQGWRIVQATDVELVHHEMTTRGAEEYASRHAQLLREGAMMREKWGDRLREVFTPRYQLFSQGTRILRVANE